MSARYHNADWLVCRILTTAETRQKTDRLTALGAEALKAAASLLGRGKALRLVEEGRALPNYMSCAVLRRANRLAGG